MKQNNLSDKAAHIIALSLSSGTTKQYKSYAQKWLDYCLSKNIDPLYASTISGIEFLTDLFYSKNVGYSCLNTARSTLSLIIEPQQRITFGSQPLVRRFMNGIFKLRPSFPKYAVTYEVKTVLDYLETIQTSILTPLKGLSHKLSMLLCLLSGQRNQSMAALDIEYMNLTDNFCHFFIPEILKTTRPGHHLQPLELNRYPKNINLCPVALIKTYIAVTADFREREPKLFISYKPPHKKVTSATLARWCKRTLQAAGIDCKTFSAHSTRSAATSAAHRKGLTLSDLNKAAGWANARTFAEYYKKPLKQNFGDAVLQ